VDGVGHERTSYLRVVRLAVFARRYDS
jgi:hypothetical protein